MDDVASQLGCTSLGDNGCCAESLWFDTTNNCGPKLLVKQAFYSWAGCLSSDAQPGVVLCNP